MNKPFPVYEIASDAAQAEEAMGTKFKFWLSHSELGVCLFKQARPGTGEDWSEKVAAELCSLLRLPHATYELATWQSPSGQCFPGILSPRFLIPDTELLHGNDILAGLTSNYPKHQDYGLSHHTLTLVLKALTMSGLRLPLGMSVPEGIHSAVGVFVGYLLLDAWIGNGDRHHENWGFVMWPSTGYFHLAPTYDHASCLGRELQDAKRAVRIQQKTIEQYAEKSRSAFYSQQSDRKAILTFDAFARVARKYPESALIWLGQLESVSSEDIGHILSRVPSERLSSDAAEFSNKMLAINRLRLLRLCQELT